MAKKICCPQCGHPDLQVINETSTETHGKNYSGGQGCLGFMLLGPLGLLCGLCGQGQTTTTTNTTYMVCPKCGKKFESPEELRSKINAIKDVSMPALVGVSIFMVVAVTFLAVMVFQAEFGGALLAGLLFGAFIAGLIFATNKMNESNRGKLQSQLYQLETAMSKFDKPAPALSQSVQNASAGAVKPTEWRCDCGRVNQNYVSNCVCGKNKRHIRVVPSVSVPKTAAVPAESGVKNEKWECSCGRINPAYTSTCICGKSKLEQIKRVMECPAVEPVPVSKSWECSACLTQNDADANFCKKCGTSKAAKDV